MEGGSVWAAGSGGIEKVREMRIQRLDGWVINGSADMLL